MKKVAIKFRTLFVLAREKAAVVFSTYALARRINSIPAAKVVNMELERPPNLSLLERPARYHAPWSHKTRGHSLFFKQLSLSLLLHKSRVFHAQKKALPITATATTTLT